MEKYVDVAQEGTDEPKEKYDAKKMLEYLEKLQEAVDDLDMDGMGEVIKQMDGISLDEKEGRILGKMKEAVEGLEVEICEQLIVEWKNLIQI